MMKAESRFEEDPVLNRRSRAKTIAWCHDGVTGGAKRACYQMVRELARRGYVIDEYIVSPYPELEYLPLSPFVRKSKIIKIPARKKVDLRPYSLEISGEAFWEWRWEAACEDLFRQTAHEIDRLDHDFIHIDYFPNAFAPGLLPHLNKQSILFCHEALGKRYEKNEGSSKPISFNQRLKNYAELLKQKRSLKKESQRIVAAGNVLANSVYTADQLRIHFAQRSRICYLGVDTENFKPSSEKPEKMILSVGRLVEAKRHHEVIESAALLPEGLRPKIVIATPETVSNEGKRLEALASEKNVRLEIVYAPTQAALVKLYQSAICAAFVPVMEAFGLVPLEAMACGTPVIGIREGGLQETILDGVTGFLVTRDSRDISKAMESLLKDSELRRRMSLQALNFIREQWTWDKCLDRYERYVL